MKRRTPRVRVASSDIAIGTTVQAPSIVNAESKSARNAAALSNALGFASNIVEDNAQRQQDSDIDAGIIAAQSGDVDEATLASMQQSAAFVFGAEKVLAKQRIISDASAAREFYQTEFDKNKSLPELRKALDGFWDNLYGGVSKGIAREIAPLMAAATDDIIANHAKFQEQQTHIQLVGAQRDILSDALDSGTLAPELWNQIRQEGSSVIGTSAQNELAVEAIDRFARENLDETIWQRPEFAKLRDNDRFKDDIAASIGSVRTARIEAAEQASFAQQGQTLAELDILADEGNAAVPALINLLSKPNKDGVVHLDTEAKVKAAWLRYWKGTSKGNINSVNNNLWATGQGQDLKPEDRDSAATQDADRRREEVLAQGGTPEQAADAALLHLINRSVVNNHLPDSLKEQINSSPRNSQKFLKAVQIHQQFEAEQPGFFGRNADSDVTRDILLFNKIVAEDGDPQRALDVITNIDRKLFDNLPPAAVKAAENKAVEKLLDGIAFFGTGINDTNRLRVMVKEDIEYNVLRGFTLEEAIQESFENLTPDNGRFVTVEGNLFRSGEGWEDSPGGPDQVAEFARKQFAEEKDIKTFLGNPSADDVIIKPVPNKPGFVMFTLKGDLQILAGGTPPIAISTLNENFQAELNRIAVASNLAKADAVEQAAVERLLPIPARTQFENPQLFKQLMEERQSRWNALTPTQRNAHIERETS